MSGTNTFDLWLNGVANQRYAVDSSTDLRSWSAVATNVLTSNSWHIVLSANPGTQAFFRGRWAP
jgi:hypothetical protein